MADVNQAYSHDEIRFTEKHEELLTKFETERTHDKAKYEVLDWRNKYNLFPQSTESDSVEGHRRAGTGEENN